MVESNSPPVKVPAAEVARQAIDALGGYVYQLDQTALAWLSLGDTEVLHVEFAEDVAVSRDGELDIKQIKRVAKSVTLRSTAVAKLIKSVWSFQEENRARRVTGALLTTSQIGKEKQMAFPGKLSGLAYWRIAARPGADVEPIRSALAGIDLSPEIQDFIKGASAEELRDRIIRPIRFFHNAASPAAVRDDVEQRLILLGDRMGVPAQSAKNARDSLIGALLDTIEKPIDERHVTSAQLVELFQKKTYITVPPSMFEGLPRPSTASDLTATQPELRVVDKTALPRRTAARGKQVKLLSECLVENGILWLHGSSGLGKSTLAALIALSQGVKWQLLDLRDLPVAAARSILFGVAGHFHQQGARGVVIDDMLADADNAGASALAQLARAVGESDGLIIVTCSKPPTPTLAGRLGLKANAVVEVPYLTEEDVVDMVAAAGGNPRRWARTIYLFTGGGHPQLVDARIAGLEQRGWDERELLADLTLLPDVPNDMAEERKSVRNRLLQELRPDATEFLLRLSLLHGAFDREIALTAAGAQTSIPQAGLVFDFLVGPWVEQLGKDSFRLSPLLRDSGTAGLEVGQRRDIQIRVMNHLISRSPFPADQLIQVFLIAFSHNDHAGLAWFAKVLIFASANPEKHEFKRLAEAVSIFALVDRGEGQPLVPDAPALAVMLRFAQLRVATAAGEWEKAAELITRFENEYEGAVAETREPLLVMAYSTVMLEPRVPIRPARWLGMLKTMMAMPSTRKQLERVHSTKAPFSDLPQATSHDETLFIIRGSALRSPDELVELIETLEQWPAAERNRYVGAAARVNRSLNLLVVSSWLQASRSPGFDGPAAARTYQRLSMTSSANANPDLAVELLCAQAIMLEEYADDAQGALDVLRIAQESYPNDYRLSRQRQRMLNRRGLHADALAEFETFQDRFPKDRAVDRTYAMRDAARSAAETGDLVRARYFFGEAWESAGRCGQSLAMMKAGLSADCALVEFDMGNAGAAVALMLRSLIEGEPLEPKTGTKEAYLKRIQGAAVLYMRGGSSDWPAARQARAYGMCSNVEPNLSLCEVPKVSSMMAWYQLAELEADATSGQAVLGELRKRTAKSGVVLPLEVMLVPTLLRASIRQLDAGRFVGELGLYAAAVREAITTYREWKVEEQWNFAAKKLVPVTDWSVGTPASVVKGAVLAFGLSAVTAGRGDALAAVRQEVAVVPGLNAALAQTFQLIDEPAEQHDDAEGLIASLIGRFMQGDIINATDAFVSSVRVVQFLENSFLASAVAAPVMAFYDRLWPDILRHRRFSMRGPDTNGPIILEAMRKGATAFERMVNMALASEAASRQRLSDGVRQQLATTAARLAGKRQDNP